MDAKYPSLVLVTFCGLIICASGNAISNLRLFSWRDVKSRNARSISLANMPGPPGQILPNETVAWTRQHQGCHFKQITQIVSQSGCESISIKNRMCYGVCTSIHMPGVPGVREVELCTQCKPAGNKPRSTVTLKCIGGTRLITIWTVEACACQPC